MKGTRTSGDRRVLGSGRERERKGKDESETNGRGAQVGARSRGLPYGVTPSTPAGSVPIHLPANALEKHERNSGHLFIIGGHMRCQLRQFRSRTRYDSRGVIYYRLAIRRRSSILHMHRKNYRSQDHPSSTSSGSTQRSREY